MPVRKTPKRESARKQPDIVQTEPVPPTPPPVLLQTLPPLPLPRAKPAERQRIACEMEVEFINAVDADSRLALRGADGWRIAWVIERDRTERDALGEARRVSGYLIFWER